MDSSSFDRLMRLIGTASSRRAAIAGLAALAGLSPVAGRAAKQASEDVSAAGVCGTGSANRCNRDRECCTRICRGDRCRCRRLGRTCKQNRNCCQGGGAGRICLNGRCAPRGCGTGGSCRVFVTSTTQTGALGGLDGADTICQNLAEGAGLTGTYRAWLSYDGESPATRFLQSPDPYVLIDGTRIADNWDDLTDESIQAKINLTEKGGIKEKFWSWTNTAADGTAAESPGNGTDCEGWTIGDSSAFGTWGSSDFQDRNWSYGGPGQICDTSYGLYCFEQN